MRCLPSYFMCMRTTGCLVSRISRTLTFSSRANAFVKRSCTLVAKMRKCVDGSPVAGCSRFCWLTSIARSPRVVDTLLQETRCSATQWESNERTDVGCGGRLAEWENGCPKYYRQTDTHTHIRIETQRRTRVKACFMYIVDSNTSCVFESG